MFFKVYVEMGGFPSFLYHFFIRSETIYLEKKIGVNVSSVN